MDDVPRSPWSGQEEDGRRTRRHSKKRLPRTLSLEVLAAELDTCSTAVSTRLRAINFGVLGIAWLLLLRNQDLKTLADQIAQAPLLAVIVGSLISLVLDLVQYLFAERLADAAFDRAQASSTKSTTYDQASLEYQAHLWCYRGKLALTLLVAVGLVVLIAGAIL